MATPIVWADTVLCIDADVLEEEGEALSWAHPEGVLEKWRTLAKNKIAKKLRRTLRETEKKTDAAEVLDLIGNPSVLKEVAVYLTLHQLCMDRTRAAGDLYDRKAEIYFGKFEKEFADSVSMLSIDEDEDGTISDSEKYGAPVGMEFRHGG